MHCNKLLRLAFALIAAVLAGACSKQEIDYRGHLLSFVADDAQTFGTFNPQEIIESAGNYEPSDVLDRLAWRLFKDLKGIQSDAGAYMRYREHNMGSVLLYVDDADQLQESLEKSGFTRSEHGTYVAYMPPMPVGKGFVVHGEVMWFASGGDADNCVEAVKTMEVRASRTPLKQWKVDRIAMTNTFSMLIPMGREGIYSALSIDISGCKMDLNSQTVDTTGMTVAMLPDSCYHLLDQNLVERVGSGAIAIVAAAIPSGLPWNEWLTKWGVGVASPKIAGIINDIDGTVGLGIGLEEHNDGSWTDIDNYAFTLMATMKHGTSTAAARTIANMVNQSGLPVSDIDGKTVIGSPEHPIGRIYPIGDTLIITTAEAILPRHLQFDDVTNLMGYIKVDIIAGGPVAELLGIDYSILADGVTNRTATSLTIELEGAKGGFIENIMKLLR